MGLGTTNPFPYLPGGSTGDLLFCSDSDGLISPLPDVSVGSYLRSGGVGGLPLWSTLKLPNAGSTGDLLAATSLNTIGVIPGGSIGQVLASSGIGALPAYTPSPSLTDVFLSGLLRNASGTNSIKPAGIAGLMELNAALGLQWTVPSVNVAVGALDWTYGAATIRYRSAGDVNVGRWSPQPTAVDGDAGYRQTTTTTGGAGAALISALRGDAVAGSGAGNTIAGVSGRVTDDRAAVAGKVAALVGDVGGTNTTSEKLSAYLRGGPIQLQDRLTVAEYGSAQSTPATPAVVVWQKTLPSSGVWQVEIFVTGRRTDAADRAGYWRRFVVYREAAGAATLQGTVDIPAPDKESDATWTLAVSVSGNNLLVTMTGSAGQTVNWVSQAEITESI